jgi:hypothetical protein
MALKADKDRIIHPLSETVEHDPLGDRLGMLEHARQEWVDHRDPKYLLRYLENMAWMLRGDPSIAGALQLAGRVIEQQTPSKIYRERRTRNWRRAVDHFLREAGIKPGDAIPGSLIDEMAAKVNIGPTTVRNYIYLDTDCFLHPGFTGTSN